MFMWLELNNMVYIGLVHFYIYAQYIAGMLIYVVKYPKFCLIYWKNGSIFLQQVPHIALT